MSGSDTGDGRRASAANCRLFGEQQLPPEAMTSLSTSTPCQFDSGIASFDPEQLRQQMASLNTSFDDDRHVACDVITADGSYQNEAGGGGIRVDSDMVADSTVPSQSGHGASSSASIWADGSSSPFAQNEDGDT